MKSGVRADCRRRRRRMRRARERAIYTFLSLFDCNPSPSFLDLSLRMLRLEILPLDRGMICQKNHSILGLAHHWGEAREETRRCTITHVQKQTRRPKWDSPLPLYWFALDSAAGRRVLPLSILIHCSKGAQLNKRLVCSTICHFFPLSFFVHKSEIFFYNKMQTEWLP